MSRITRESLERLQRMGSFAIALGEALKNVDTGFYFARALLDVRVQADTENRARLMEAFPNLWTAFDMDEQTRHDLLADAFEDILAEAEVA